MHWLNEVIVLLSSFEMNIESGAFSVELHETLVKFKFLHQIHGAMILFERPNTCWYRAWTTFLRLMYCCYVAILVLGGYSGTSNNGDASRFICQIGALAVVEMVLQEMYFASQKEKILGLIEWCHWFEARPGKVCARPDEWFAKTRQRFLFLAR